MTVDLHLLRKLIIFATGEDRNVVSLFCYALQKDLSYASNQRVICVKLCAEVTQNAQQYALD